MRISAGGETLLRPLQLLSGGMTGGTERSGPLPILSHVLLSAREGQLTLVATDLDVELTTWITSGATVAEEGETTFPGRKLADLCF